MFNQGIPFGMYGMGHTANWPMYTANPHLLHGYQQDPYAMLGRSWPGAQIPNPWTMQALLMELIGTIARQGHLGFPALPYTVPSYPALVGPFGPQGSHGAGLPGLAGRYQGGFPGVTNFPAVTNWWDGGVGAGIGNGALGGTNFAAGLPFPTGVGNWSMPSMAMV